MSILERYDPETIRALLADADDTKAQVVATGLRAEVEAARLDWQANARPSQLPPGGDWFVWLILAGRGWGKTRTGAEWLKRESMARAGTEWVIAAPTFADVRDNCVEGPSGLLSVMPAGMVVTYNRSLGEIDLANGSHIKLVSADDPDRFRGRNLHGAWCDELASWRYREAWDEGLAFAVRLGAHPRIVVTTTPRPIPLVRELVARAGADVHLTQGSTFENAENLSAAALAQFKARYDGTRIGRQELWGQLLEDVEGALWNMVDIEVLRRPEAPVLRRVTVAVDPPGGATECGIVVAGVAAGPCGCGGGSDHVFVLADYSLAGPPSVWGSRAVGAYREHHADRLVAELNFGADMVTHVVETVDRSVPVTVVRATRGKLQRAEPVQALYEQGRVHHVGVLAGLEQQMTEWVPGESGFSPDRVDALVWAVHELVLDGAGPASLAVPGGRAPGAGLRSNARGRVRVGTAR